MGQRQLQVRLRTRDYPAAQPLQQPLEGVQALGRATFKIGANHKFYAELMASQVKSQREYEPLQLTSSASATAVLDPSTWYPLNSQTRATYDKIFNALTNYFGRPTGLRRQDPVPLALRRVWTAPDRNHHQGVPAAGRGGGIGNWDYDVGLSHASNKAESVLAGGYYFSSGLKQALGNGLLESF